MLSSCEWPVNYAECQSCGPLEAMEPEERERFEQMAVEYLWNWTGRGLGVCEVTLRPCGRGVVSATTFWGNGPTSGTRHAPFTWQPALIGGQWYNLTCGSCGDTCGCGSPSSIRLPGPVDHVVQVKINGEVLDPDSYRIDNRNILVRIDGGSWPREQDMSSEDDQPGTWSITYGKGSPVPSGGQIAAGVLACELAKAACNDKSCALPQRVQTVTRQGVTIAMLDSFDDVGKGRTGIWLIDSWVSSIIDPPRPAKVHSPDLRGPATRRTTWRPTT